MYGTFCTEKGIIFNECNHVLFLLVIQHTKINVMKDDIWFHVSLQVKDEGLTEEEVNGDIEDHSHDEDLSGNDLSFIVFNCSFSCLLCLPTLVLCFL